MRVRLHRSSVPILIGALLLLVSSANCGGNGAPQLPPGIQIEGQIALYGTKVLEATDQALTAVDTLADAKVINSADTVAIVTRLKQVGVEGKRLAEALKIVDEARADSPERRTALTTARQIVETIQKLVDQAVIPISDPGLRQRISGVLLPLVQILLTLSLSTGGLS